MPSIKNSIAFMITACRDWSLGYDQGNRWDIRDGGECDCSSLVYSALWAGGFLQKPSGNLYNYTLYTGSLREHLKAAGWKVLSPDLSQAKPGDVLLNDGHHVCMVVEGTGWNAKIAQASIDERGRATGGASGDQGNETNIRSIYTYSKGWSCILRWPGESDDGGAAGKLDVDGCVGPVTITEWQAQCGTPQDGVVSGQAESCSKWYPRLTSVTFEGGGSTLMKKIQSKVGVPNPKGIISRGTVCMLQGWLVLKGYDIGSDKAGELGDGTAKALQKSLNDRKWA